MKSGENGSIMSSMPTKNSGRITALTGWKKAG